MELAADLEGRPDKDCSEQGRHMGIAAEFAQVVLGVVGDMNNSAEAVFVVEEVVAEFDA